MLNNYIKIAVRSSIKHWGQSLINVGGLAIGMACCILMMLWVVDELSYDTFHENYEQLYRVTETWEHGEETYNSSLVSVPLVMAIKEEVPEIREASRFYIAGPQIVKHGDVRFESDKLAYADPEFLDMFTFPVVNGDRETALSETFSIVITQEMSARHFGEENPVGQTINVGRRDFVVTAVLEDLPRNSHVQFDCLAPFDARPDYLKAITDDNWTVSAFYAYVQLHPDTDISEIVAKIDEIQVAHMTESEGSHGSGLQHIGRIHLWHDIEDFFEGHGEIKYVYLFSVLALLTLLIACINFMNLSTARSGRRSKEVGMRKIAGARRGDLVRQFFSESLFLALVSLILALALVETFLPWLNQWTGKELSIITSGNLIIILGFFGIGLFAGIVAGSYPAVLLSSFLPSRVLKGQWLPGRTGKLFRRLLVTAQFAVTIGLICAATVIYSQLDFIRSRSLGFDHERLIYFTMRGDFFANFETIKSELLQHPAVAGVAGGVPPVRHFGPVMDADWENKDTETDIRWSSLPVDADYLSTLGMEIKAGRGFSADLTQNSTQGFVVNQAAARAMGTDSPIGKRFSFTTHSLIGHLEHISYEGNIVGVVSDFHHGSLHSQIAPVVMFLDPEQFRHVCVRTAEGRADEAITLLNDYWARFCPDYLFEYRFVDEAIDSFYRSEQRLSVILYSFTFLAIFVTCLGLIGLASFAAEQRTKEIGVRKVLGATVSNLVTLLSREFVVMVVIAGVIAGPIAWWVMDSWLQDFAYRTEIGWLTPIAATILALTLALATVGFQAIRTAIANPIDALRCE